MRIAGGGDVQRVLRMPAAGAGGLRRKEASPATNDTVAVATERMVRAWLASEWTSPAIVRQSCTNCARLSSLSAIKSYLCEASGFK